MKLLLSFIPLIWLSQNVQEELIMQNGEFDYYRFWNPDVQEKVGDYHIWCWGSAALKFSDDDVVMLVNGEFPNYSPLTAEDMELCKG